MKIAIIGTGSVGQTFAVALTTLGHQVIIGTRNVEEKLSVSAKDGFGNPSFSEWYASNKAVKLGTFAEAAVFGDIIVNATQGSHSLNALQLAGSEHIKGKIVIDIANPLDFSKGMPPSLIPELSNTHSLGEEIQNKFPESFVVKTLNTMWNGLMVNPNLIAGGDHTVFICGNNEETKTTVKFLLHEFGWRETAILDLGDISASRGMEAILPIWLRIWTTTQNGAFNFKIVN